MCGCRGSVSLLIHFFSESIQFVEDLVFGEYVEVVVTGTRDGDKPFWPGVKVVEFFSMPWSDHLILVTVNDEEWGLNGVDNVYVSVLVA